MESTWEKGLLSEGPSQRFEEVGGAHSKLCCWALTELIDLCSAKTGGGRSSDQKQELGGWPPKGV